MRVIIPGGSGLIGGELAASLVTDGHEVTVLSRRPEQARDRLAAGVSVVGWDGKSADGWGHLVEGADAIVNLAGMSLDGGSFLPKRWTAARKQQYIDSRVEPGRAVVEAIRAAGEKPKALIQASASGYYEQDTKEPVTEDSPNADSWQAALCREWEEVTAEVEAMGVRRAIIRTGMVLSTAGGAFPRLLLPFKLFAGGPMGSGRQWMPWIHHEDEVGAIRFLIEREDASGPFNLCAPNPVTNTEFARVLGRVTRRPSFVPVPGFALRLAFGEVAELVLKGWHMLPKRLEEQGFSFKYVELEAALREMSTDDGAMKFEHRFRVEAPREAVAEFHRHASALKALTPPPIFVQLDTPPPDSLGEGDSFTFTMWVGPLPFKWGSRIEEVSAEGFSDVQTRGAFAFWRHRHHFIRIDDQTTEVYDQVEARLRPHLLLGPVGLAMWLGMPLLFAYRAWRTRKLLAG